VSKRLPMAVRRLPLRVRLAASIERLPEAQRLVLALRLLDGLSAVEAAGALKLTAREVESRYTLALESLATELGSTLARAA
jgi:DNA-directed RNA polymerase specialized sigma24 family protein